MFQEQNSSGGCHMRRVFTWQSVAVCNGGVWSNLEAEAPTTCADNLDFPTFSPASDMLREWLPVLVARSIVWIYCAVKPFPAQLRKDALLLLFILLPAAISQCSLNFFDMDLEFLGLKCIELKPKHYNTMHWCLNIWADLRFFIIVEENVGGCEGFSWRASGGHWKPLSLNSLRVIFVHFNHKL